MTIQDQIVEQKVLSFKTLTTHNSQQISKFIVQNCQSSQSLSEQKKNRLFSITNLLIIPALKSQWSFGLFENQRIIGVYLQLDALDYLNICKVVGQGVVKEIFGIDQFNEYFGEEGHRLRRGDYLVTIFNQMDSDRNISTLRKEINLIHQGFYLCKLGGWKNIIFHTYNPIPFLKINGEVIAEFQSQEFKRRKYLMKLKMKDLNLCSSPFQKVYAKL